MDDVILGDVVEQVEAWTVELAGWRDAVAGVFTRPEPREIFAQLVAGLLSSLPKKNGWTLADDEKARKLLNKAIFTKIYLDSSERHPTAIDDDLAEPVAALIYGVQAVDGRRAKGRALGRQEGVSDATRQIGGLLALCLEGQSASKATMVGCSWNCISAGYIRYADYMISRVHTGRGKIAHAHYKVPGQ